jgi:hypothetical protein
MEEIWSIPKIIERGDDWLQTWLTPMSIQTCSRVLMIAWRVWHARNEVTHDKDLPNVEGSKRFIYSYMNSLENIRKASPEDIIRGKQALGEQRFEKSSAVPTTQEIWNKPPLGILKLNVDGAYITQTGAGGAGMILRDSKGLIIFSACRSLVFCSSALEAELQACLEGLKFALNLSHDKILVETDSLELVRHARLEMVLVWVI